MHRKVQVCAGCTHICRLFHRAGKKSTSFFKVMFGSDFSRVLYLPPKFRPIVADLIHKKVFLRDSRGQQWRVTVSIVDSSVAFVEGWNKFSLDHGLEVGDFVLFHYIGELYFNVMIYDESGCERLDYSKHRNQKKRHRNRSCSPARDGKLARKGSNASVASKPNVSKTKNWHRETDLGGTQNYLQNISNDNNNERAQSLCKVEYYEDPCMVGQDFGNQVNDDRISILDLLDFEMQNNHGVDGNGRITAGDSKISHVDYGSHVSQNDASFCDKDPLLKGMLGRGAASDASEFELSGRNYSIGETDKGAHNKTSTLKFEENRENNSIMSGEVREHQFPEGSGETSKMINKEHVDMLPNAYSYKDKLQAAGELSKKIKEEHVDVTVCSQKDKLGETGDANLGPLKVIEGEWGQSSNTIIQDDGSVLNAVNAEPSYSQSNDGTAATVSCVVPSNNDDFLELPACLPQRRKVRMDGMVVLLRDPSGKLWPVLYHERPQFKILKRGWVYFCRGNDIQPDDECTFKVEDESKRIFAVEIVRK